MKDVCMIKCINTLTKFFLNIYAVLAKLVEKWKEALEAKGFDCIKYDLLIAKLAAYGFVSHSLSLVLK